MLIIIIAWLYVVILMSMTFLLYGVLPLSVVVYLLNTPARRARRKAAEAKEWPDTAEDESPQRKTTE